MLGGTRQRGGASRSGIDYGSYSDDDDDNRRGRSNPLSSTQTRLALAAVGCLLVLYLYAGGGASQRVADDRFGGEEGVAAAPVLPRASARLPGVPGTRGEEYPPMPPAHEDPNDYPRGVDANAPAMGLPAEHDGMPGPGDAAGADVDMHVDYDEAEEMRRMGWANGDPTGPGGGGDLHGMPRGHAEDQYGHAEDRAGAHGDDPAPYDEDEWKEFDRLAAGDLGAPLFGEGEVDFLNADAGAAGDQYWDERQKRASRLAAEAKRARQVADDTARELFKGTRTGPADTEVGSWASNAGRVCQIHNTAADFLPAHWKPSHEHPRCAAATAFSAVSGDGKVSNVACDGSLFFVARNRYSNLERSLALPPDEHHIFRTFSNVWRHECTDPHNTGRCDPYHPPSYVEVFDAEQGIHSDEGYWLAHRLTKKLLAEQEHEAFAGGEEGVIAVCVGAAERQRAGLPEGSAPESKEHLAGHEAHRYQLHLRNVFNEHLHAQRAELFAVYKVMAYGAVDPVSVGLDTHDDERDAHHTAGGGDAAGFDDLFGERMEPEFLEGLDRLDTLADEGESGFAAEWNDDGTWKGDTEGEDQFFGDDNSWEPAAGAGGNDPEAAAHHAFLPGNTPGGGHHDDDAAAAAAAAAAFDPAVHHEFQAAAEAAPMPGQVDDRPHGDPAMRGARRRLLEDPAIADTRERLERNNEQEQRHEQQQEQPAMTEDEANEELHGSKRTHHPLNVVVLYTHSLSQAHMLRAMPKTVAAMRGLKKRGRDTAYEAFEFARHAALGDTPSAFLAPLLASMDYSHMPSDAAWLWQLYQARGYVTAYVEEECPVHDETLARLLTGTESMSLAHMSRDDHEAAMLVSRQTADHTVGEVMCPLQQLTGREALCVGGRPLHEQLLEYVEQMFGQYDQQVGKFAVLNLREAAEPTMTRAYTADAGVAAFVERLTEQHPDTLVVLASDHGSSRSEYYRRSEGARAEARLPALWLLAPQWLLTQYPHMRAALTENQNALVTAFDVHQTLRHVLTYPHSSVYTHLAHFESRGEVLHGESLFEVVPQNRTCDAAGVPPTMCPCQEWRGVKADEPYWLSLAAWAARALNSLGGERAAGSPCKEVSLQRLVAVHRQVVVDLSEKVRLELEVLAGGRAHLVEVLVEERATKAALDASDMHRLTRQVAGGGLAASDHHPQWYLAHPHVTTLGAGAPVAMQQWSSPEFAPLRLEWTRPDGRPTPASEEHLSEGQWQTAQRYHPDGAASSAPDDGATPGAGVADDSPAENDYRLEGDGLVGMWHLALHETEVREADELPREGVPAGGGGGEEKSPGVNVQEQVARMEAQAAAAEEPKALRTARVDMYVAKSFDSVPDKVWSHFWNVHSLTRRNSKSADCGAGPDGKPARFCFC